MKYFLTSLVMVFSFTVLAQQTTTTQTPSSPGIKEEMEFFKEEAKVFSASRKEQSISEAPQVVTVITPEMMKRFGIKTVHDALSLVPGFDIQKEVRKEFHWTRGNRESALMLIDGVSVLNPLDNEAYFDKAINIEMIKRIEVLRGPGGVLWGRNAFLGVVNVITKDPTASPFAEISAEGGSYESQRYGLQSSYKWGNLGFYVAGHYWDTLKQDISIQNASSTYSTITPGNGGTGMNKNNWFSSIFAKIKYDNNWTISYFQDNHSEYTPLTDLQPILYKNDAFRESDVMKLLLLQYNSPITENVDFKGKTWWLTREVYIYIPRDSNGTTFMEYDNPISYVNGADIQFDFKSAFGIEQSNSLISGFTYEKITNTHDDFRLRATAGGAETVTPLSGLVERDVYGLYFQDTYAINKYWTTGAGLRGEFTNTKINPTDGNTYLGWRTVQHDPQYIFNVNSVYQFSGGDTLKLIVANSYRKPDFEQTGSQAVGFTGNNTLGDEQVYSYELDYVWKISDQLSWQNNYSYNQIYGLIDFINDGSGSYTGKNLPNAYIHSVETEFKVKLNDGSYGFLNANYKDGKTSDGEDFSIENTNKINANLAFYYKFLTGSYWANVFKYVGEKTDAHNLDDGNAPTATTSLKTVDAYYTWDTGLTWDDAFLKGLDASAFVYNVLDQEYYHQIRPTKIGYSQIQQGRTYALRLTYSF